MDPELEAFIPLVSHFDLTDPAAARKVVAERAAAAPAPDTTGMEIEDLTVPADPGVPVRVYRPDRRAIRRPAPRPGRMRRSRHG